MVLIDVQTDGRGLEDIQRLADEVDECVCVAVLPDESELGLDTKARERGAKYVATMGGLLSDILGVLMQMASDRTQLSTALSEAREEARRESRTHEQLRQKLTRRLGKNAEAETSAQESDGGGGIKDHAPEEFERMQRRFKDLLELALERQVYKVDHNIGGSLRQMAEHFAELRAGPRDLVMLYSDALGSKRKPGAEKKYKAYAEEGQILLLELMGNLATEYRRLFLACEESDPSDPSPSTPNGRTS
jgi:hypothetical protein